MFGIFNIKKNNNKEKQPASKPIDDFVTICPEDDEWEEISSSSSSSKKSSAPIVTPVITPITEPVVIPVSPVISITPPMNNIGDQEVFEEVLPVIQDVPAPKPMWLQEFEKRDKTPYVMPSAGVPPYTMIGSGTPYAQPELAQHSYMTNNNHSEPYALGGVSPVAYTSTYAAEAIKEVEEKETLPYCVAY